MLCYAIVISKLVSNYRELSGNKKRNENNKHDKNDILANDDKGQINPRLPKKWLESLDEYAKQHNLNSRNEAAAEIIPIYFIHISHKQQANNIIMMDCVLSLLLDSASNPEKMDENSKKAADTVLAEMDSQVIKLDVREFKTRVSKWHVINPFKIASHKNGNSTIYKIRHSMGQVFSEFQCKMYKEMMKRMGIDVVDSSFDNLGYKMEIVWP